MQNDIIPYIVACGKAIANRFPASCVRPPHETGAYWRDVGTADSYWEANIDLDLFDREWPIWTDGAGTPPAKFVHDEGDCGAGGVLACLRRLHWIRCRDKALGSVYRRAALAFGQ